VYLFALLIKKLTFCRDVDFVNALEGDEINKKSLFLILINKFFSNKVHLKALINMMI